MTFQCQILFSGKNKKNIINLSSAENAQRVVKVKLYFALTLPVSRYGLLKCYTCNKKRKVQIPQSYEYTKYPHIDVSG